MSGVNFGPPDTQKTSGVEMPHAVSYSNIDRIKLMFNIAMRLKKKVTETEMAVEEHIVTKHLPYMNLIEKRM
jgi:hypothetical protein